MININVLRGKGNMEKIFELNTIDEKVNHLIKSFNVTSAPVNIEEICEKYGIGLCSIDLSELEKEAGRPISGILTIEKDEKVIATNKNDIYERRRFTIAHELGHYFMSKSMSNSISISFRGLYNEEERNADEFAAKLIMPKELVVSEYKEMLYPILSKLAGAFEVSKPAMRRRLRELRLEYIDL